MLFFLTVTLSRDVFVIQLSRHIQQVHSHTHNVHLCQLPISPY